MSELRGDARGAGKVLLVDDNPTNLKVLNDTLKDRGYDLRIARSGEQALQVAGKSLPDLILLDVMMQPGIDGYETIRRLKQQSETKDTPVIFLSALGETPDKVKGLDLGTVDYITKPFKADEVIARVNTHLTMHRLRQDLRQRNQELESANGRMKKDLDAAARVQQSMLPASLPKDDRVKIGWQYHPCDQLGGDSLGVHRLMPDHLSFYIVDVSGHGVSSALLAVSVSRSLEPSNDPSSLVTGTRGTISGPAELAQRLNILYRMTGHGNHYFTMVYAVLDLRRRLLRFTTAGHPGPVLVRRGEQAQQVTEPSVPVGLFEEATFTESELELAAGDRVYLFSDGFYEETNEAGEQFEISRLVDAIGAVAGEPLELSIEKVRQDLAAWHGGNNFTDDLSILGFEMTAD